MNTKNIAPSLGLSSFSCPHCHAIAHQIWFQVYLNSYPKGKSPHMPDAAQILDIELNDEISSEQREIIVEWVVNMNSKQPFLTRLKSSIVPDWLIDNLYVSRCFSCEGLLIWASDNIAHPQTSVAVEPNEDLPDDIKLDFSEAAKIVNLSPRGAAALLRL